MELIYTHTQALPIHTHNVRVRTQNWLNSNIPNTCTLRRKPMHLRDVLYVHKSKKADNEPILDVIQNVEFAEVFFSLLKLTLLLALSIGGCLSSKLKMLKKKVRNHFTTHSALRSEEKGAFGKVSETVSTDFSFLAWVWVCWWVEMSVRGELMASCLAWAVWFGFLGHRQPNNKPSVCSDTRSLVWIERLLLYDGYWSVWLNVSVSCECLHKIISDDFESDPNRNEPKR